MVHAETSSELRSDPHRRRAAYLYGLIVSGAVLATAPDEFRLIRVGVLLLFTLCIYWAAETYVNSMSARSMMHRPLTRPERRMVLMDGWPLVAASAVPLVVLLVEALLGVDTGFALDVTLAVNSMMLFVIGWRLSKLSGLTGIRLVASAALAGMLGVTMILLKTLMH